MQIKETKIRVPTWNTNFKIKNGRDKFYSITSKVEKEIWIKKGIIEYKKIV